MTERVPASAQAEVTIDADADAVYRLITDLPTLASLAEENEAMEWRKGERRRPARCSRAHNRNGSHRWTHHLHRHRRRTGRVFAFDVRYSVLPIAHWRYDIVPAEGGGCRVTERTWDRRPGWFSKTGVGRHRGVATATPPTPSTSSSPWRG